MREAYPVIFTHTGDGKHNTFVIDFEVGTNGDDIADAIQKTRDLIGVSGLDMIDNGNEIPLPFTNDCGRLGAGAFISMIDIDFEEYRRAHDMRTVRRNVSLPSWLNVAADKAGLNVSAVLQDALKKELNIE